MRTILHLTLGFILGALLMSISDEDRFRFESDNHTKEIQSTRDSLSKCNGITARINKDSTYYIKNR